MNLATVTIRIVPTKELMDAAGAIQPEQDCWEDVVSSVLSDLAERIATGDTPLNMTRVSERGGRVLAVGETARHDLMYYPGQWKPGTERKAGTVEVCLGDDAQEDSGAGAVGAGDQIPMGERLKASLKKATLAFAEYPNSTNWDAMEEAHAAYVGYYATFEGKCKAHPPGCD